jgi:hypothetical protein
MARVNLLLQMKSSFTLSALYSLF